MRSQEYYLRKIYHILLDDGVPATDTMLSKERYAKMIWEHLTGADANSAGTISSYETYLSRIWKYYAGIEVSENSAMSSAEVYLRRIWKLVSETEISENGSMLSAEHSLQQISTSISGAVSDLTYAGVLQSMGFDEIWPEVNAATGTTIPAYINPSRNGTMSGLDLLNTAGPVTGTLAPYSEGNTGTDRIDVYTSNGTDGLSDIFNGSIGTLFGWTKIPASAYTNGVNSYAIFLSTSGSANRVGFYKSSSINRITYLYRANNVTKTYSQIGHSNTNWFSWAITYDINADTVKFFLDGVVVASYNSLGVWSGALSSLSTTLGASDASGADSWKGWQAYTAVKFGSAMSEDDILAAHNAASTAEPNLPTTIPTYAELMSGSIYAADEVAPLVDISSGTVIPAFVNVARNGVLADWSLQNTVGPVTGTLAPYGAGAINSGNFTTTGGGVGTVDIFDPNLGSIAVWGKHQTWTENNDFLMSIQVNANNRIYVKLDSPNNMQIAYAAGGTTKISTNATSGGWHHFGLSWDTGADQAIAYFDGVPAATMTGLGVWTGTPSFWIGSLSGTSLCWNGWYAYASYLFGAKWTGAQFAGMVAVASISAPD